MNEHGIAAHIRKDKDGKAARVKKHVVRHGAANEAPTRGDRGKTADADDGIGGKKK